MATRRLLLPSIALLVAVLAPSLSGLAEASAARAPAQRSAALSTTPTDTVPTDTVPTDIRTDVPSTDEPAPPSTVVADNPFGLPSVDPIDGGRLIPDASVEVVHRWTITPEGSNDPNAASSRSELSYVGERGSVITDGVTVFNLGNEVLTFRIYSTDAVNGADGSFSLLSSNQPSTDVGTWVKVAQEYVTLEPGMASTIPISIAIPDDASPGDHVGGVMASSSTGGATDDGTVIGLDRGVGTRLYVRVAGPLRPELAVEGLAVDHYGSANPLQGSADVMYRIHNRGNVRLSGTHRLTTAGPFGIARHVGDEVAFSDVLPGQSISVTTRVDDLPTLGWVNAEVELNVSGSDGAAASDRVSTTELALPIALLLLLLLVGLSAATARRIRRHRLAESVGVSTDQTVDTVREHQLT